MVIGIADSGFDQRAIDGRIEKCDGDSNGVVGTVEIAAAGFRWEPGHVRDGRFLDMPKQAARQPERVGRR